MDQQSAWMNMDQDPQALKEPQNLEQLYLQDLLKRRQQLANLQSNQSQIKTDEKTLADVNLKPVIAYADSLLGTNVAQGYQTPVPKKQSEAERLQSLIDKEKQSLQDDQLNLLKLKELGSQKDEQLALKEQFLEAYKTKIAGDRANQQERADKPEKITADSWMAGGYAKRLQQSEDVFNNLLGSGYSGPGRADQITSFLPKEAQSPEYRKYDQAARNFINATLRRESGAAIAQSEFDNAYEQYLPRAGDPPEVMAQKAANRRQVFESMKAQGQGAFDKIPYISPVVGKVESNEVTVSNGKETLTIPRADLKDALKEGFREVK